jgi:hypothetical protein
MKAANRWTINPMQVPRDFMKDGNITKVMVLHESEGQSEQYSSTYENDTDKSFCPSPVKIGPGVELHVISPNKLKSFIKDQQAEVLFQIECTKQQIIENSPSKNTFIEDDDFLEFLNVKR